MRWSAGIADIAQRAAVCLNWVAFERDLETIVNRVLQFLFASDISLGRLNRSVSQEKSNLFEFAAAIVAKSGTGSPKIMWSQIFYAGLAGTPLDGIPDHVRCHASLPSPAKFRNSSKTRPSVTPECESQASSNSLDHDGTGTVRSRLPLPIKSTITQRTSRVCS